MESSDCAAALEASVFHSHGGTELSRFLEGAQARGDVAVLVSTIGDASDDGAHSPFGGDDASILLPGMGGSIGGRRLPEGVNPRLAEKLGTAERDLGLRLLQRAGDAPWWSLSLGGMSLEPAVGPSQRRNPSGRLEPILVDSLGQPVVAVCVSDTGDQRWYVVPAESSWDVLLDWLLKQALAEHVPEALRRARSPLALDPALWSVAETKARQALVALEAEYERERRRLEGDLAQATADAGPIRDGLLYGTADVLEDAVAAVLTAAGLDVINLDEELGDTVSADLLVTYKGERRLMEIKSASGAANEKLVAALDRHLDTWPQLKPGLPVDGGVLVVNHQHRLDPAERSAEVYSRPEFVASLRAPVVSSRQLFDWWRVSDWAAIREAVFRRVGESQKSTVATALQGAATATPQDPARPTPPAAATQAREPTGWRARLTRRLRR